MKSSTQNAQQSSPPPPDTPRDAGRERSGPEPGEATPPSLRGAPVGDHGPVGSSNSPTTRTSMKRACSSMISRTFSLGSDSSRRARPSSPSWRSRAASSDHRSCDGGGSRALPRPGWMRWLARTQASAYCSAECPGWMWTSKTKIMIVLPSPATARGAAADAGARGPQGSSVARRDPSGSTGMSRTGFETPCRKSRASLANAPPVTKTTGVACSAATAAQSPEELGARHGGPHRIAQDDVDQ